MSYMQVEGDAVTCFATCDRCGFEWTFPSRYLYRENYRHDLCRECTAQPQNSVLRNGVTCKPWHGDFDENDNPMKDGVLYKPGERTCGARDCVNTNHIKPVP